MKSVQFGEWNCECVQYRLRRVKKYGDKYDGTCTITITDGDPHVEGLLSLAGFTHKDRDMIYSFIRSLGFDYFISSKFVNGERVIKKEAI